ncbi:MAG: dienelactone hydrolase family protein [Anaerolineae bacterium]
MDRIYVMQLVRSFQVGELSRRDFLRKATLALGSVASANLLLAACATSPATNPPPVVEEPQESSAAEPAAATGDGGVSGAMVEYEDTDGETLMGYLAKPAGDGPFPGVIVIQEWWGLNEHIKDVARRFAAEGYVALAPDLYHGVVTTEPDEARKQVMALDMAEAVKEIQRGAAYLREQPQVAGPKVGVVGFCMGGGLVLQTALAEENMGAGVVFYGRPLEPEQAAQVKAPILGLFGAEDGGIPVDAVEAMHAAFTEAGVTNDVTIYEGAPHAFFNDTRESYRPEAAGDAWQKTLAWFGEYLAG